MHEHRIAAVLVEEAARSAGLHEVVAMHVTLGALAPVTPRGLTAALQSAAQRRWGTAPEVAVAVRAAMDGSAGEVVLSSIVVDG